MLHICAKFELSSFSPSVDRRGSQIFNAGHETRATPPVRNYIFFQLVLAMIHVSK